jgi:hypothetical protein
MTIYDKYAEDCVRIAEYAKHQSDRADLLRLAEQWRIVSAEHAGEVSKHSVLPTPAMQAIERR